MDHSPTDIQLDALREVANIGIGHAASALSRLVGGKKVQIDVARAHVADRQTLPKLLTLPPEPLLVAAFRVLGEFKGQLLLVMASADAQRLAGVLAAGTKDADHPDVRRSALAEAANILASACLSAIGDLARMTLLPSVPDLKEWSDSDVVREAVHEVETGAGLGVILEASFTANTELPVTGRLVMAPDTSSIKRLLQKLGV